MRLFTRRLLRRNKKLYLSVFIILVYRFIISYRNSHTSPMPEKLKYVVVHIDLKGSPLNLKFLTSILSELRMLGANALLMEYEDMFPYENELAVLSRPRHYKRDELLEFLTAASGYNMEVIPLVQTFGHMEFVLKHQKFQYLRENPEHPNSICPSKLGTSILISAMLKQIIELHQSVRPLEHIHIGCDEVYDINTCVKCKRTELNKHALFLKHVKTVSNLVWDQSPNTTVLIWDDMMRSIKGIEAIIDAEIPRNIEPVYWNYGKNFNDMHLSLFTYRRYFQNTWIASAYKGADGKDATTPNYENRIKNLWSWLHFIKRYAFGGENNNYKFKGIILTGWSRYSHFDPLCELFPIAYPVLISQLLLINKFHNGLLSEKVHLIEDWNSHFKHNYLEDYYNQTGCKYNHFETDDCILTTASLLHDSIDQYFDYLNHIISFFKRHTNYEEEIYGWCVKTSRSLLTVEFKTKLYMRMCFMWEAYGEFIRQKSFIVHRYLIKCLKRHQQEIIQE